MLRAVGFTLLGFALAPAGAAQESAPATDPSSIVDAALAEEPSEPKLRTFERLGRLVSAGRAALPILLERLRERKVDPATDEIHCRLGEAISLLALPTDDEAIDALLAFVTDDRSLLVEWRPLLRIGGRAAREALDRLEKSNLSPEELRWTLDPLWTLREPTDLEYAIGALTRLARRPGPRYVQVQAEVECVPRLRIALDFRRHPDASETRRHLLAMVRKEHPDFILITGGLAEYWALDRLVELQARETVPELVRIRASWPSNPHQLVRAIVALGGSVPESDARYKLPDGTPYGPTFSLARLDVNANDLLRSAASLPLDRRR